MEPEISLPFSQVPTTEPYANQSTPTPVSNEGLYYVVVQFNSVYFVPEIHISGYSLQI
jgi:hypothetical protein